MSEQAKTQNFMEELDDWSVQVIVEPLLDNGPDAIVQIKQAIREKVLQSYRNGKAASGRLANNASKTWRR